MSVKKKGLAGGQLVVLKKSSGLSLVNYLQCVQKPKVPNKLHHSSQVQLSLKTGKLKGNIFVRSHF